MQKLDPKAAWLFFFSYVGRTMVPVFFLGIWLSVMMLAPAKKEVVFESSGSLAIASVAVVALIGLAVLLVLYFIWAKLSCHFYRYELLDSGFRKESGVIRKSYVTIPYDRIQNVDINRGLLARILGLSELNIQTAGASAIVMRHGAMGIGAEGRLPGVSKEIAEKLRDDLLARMKGSRNQGL